jgi:nucleotide-binding universal stress UspA family protein
MRDFRPSDPDRDPDEAGARPQDAGGAHAENWTADRPSANWASENGTAPDRHISEATEPAVTADVEPLRLPPLFARRHSPWLLVEVDGSAPCQGALVWALREAARREATVLAVTVLDDPGHPLGAARPSSPTTQAAALQRLEAQVLRAIAETGVHGRSRTAVLERPVFEALSAAAAGADLVIVGTTGKTVLRPAVARPAFRRLPRGA